MNRINALARGALRPGLYVAKQDETIARVEEAVATAGYKLYVVDLRDADSKHEFLRRFANSMHFPAYFGFNWDAFIDSASDLSWNGAPSGIVIIAKNIGEFASTEDFYTSTMCLNDIIDRWWTRGVPMHVILAEHDVTDVLLGVPRVT